MCKICIRKLNSTFKFKTLCIESNKALIKYNDELKNRNQEDSDYEVLYYLEVEEDYLADDNKKDIKLSDVQKYFHVPQCNGTHTSTNSDLNLNECVEKHIDNTVTTVDKEKVVNQKQSDHEQDEDKKEAPPRKIYQRKRFNADKKHKCKVCQKRFTSELRVKLHMQRLHRQIYLAGCKVICPKCGMKFEKLSNLKRHLVYHYNDSSYFSCSFCDKKLYSKKSWRAHIKVHNSVIEEICKICNKILCSEVGKIYHMDFHRMKENLHNKNYVACHTCKLDFKGTDLLESHVKEMHNQEDHFAEVEKNVERMFNGDDSASQDAVHSEATHIFKCNICNRLYINLVDLKSHSTDCIAKINRPKSFMCDICGKCFTCSWTLATHKAGHSAARKFICDICGQRFKWHNDLTNHKNRIHDKIRPYVCKYCGKKCGTSATLKSHLRSHSKERPYTCKICQTSFAQNGSLKEHMFKHTGDQEGSCPICNKVFKTPLRLRMHVKRHNTQRTLYPCDFCGRMFTEKSSVKKHKIKLHNGFNSGNESGDDKTL